MPTPRPPRRPKTTPSALTDPHLAALLLFVSGTHDDDGRHAADFAAALADTRERLTSQPLTSAFDWRRHPSVADQVRAAVATKIARIQDSYHSSVGRLILDALNGDTEETIAVKRGALRTLVSDHIDAALLRGACVMYYLLKDGAR